ncbi:DUF5794 domain-containing protein [Halorussus caseinilyticus]|uniref:DUF5794 domain-containing protein n=2 Tax=Halorussus caseinilyticus TaxID=3034025 RepID=A0ABD5WIG7_9EURY
MGLPLVDGIFPALVLAGGVETLAGVLQVGLLVFGGSATVAVILAEMDGTPREQAASVLVVGVGIVAVAAVEAAFAPTIESVLHTETFERFAALVMLAIAAKTASSRVGEYLPRPAVIVGLGMIASFQPSGFTVATVDHALILKATAAAGSGVAFALAVALTSPWLRGVVDIDRFRFGSAVALGVLPLSLLGFAPGRAPLAVLAVTSLLAFDPNSAEEAEPDETDEDDETTAAAEAMAAEISNPADPSNPAGSQAVATDGSGGSESDDAGYGYPGEEDGDEREPWL